MDTSKNMTMNNKELIKQATILLAIFIAMYFFEIASFNLSIDEEYAAFRTDPSVWVTQGRWGSYLVYKLLLPQPILPFITPAIFGLGCVAAYLLTMGAIGRRQMSFAEYSGFAVFCGFPTWFFIVEFYSNIAAVGIGVFATACAIWLAATERNALFSPRVLAAVLAGAFAISIYQSFTAALLTMGIAVAVLRHRDGTIRQLQKELLRVGVVLVGSILLYAAADIAFKASTTNTSDYIDGFVQPAALLQNPIVVLTRTVNSIGDIYGFRNKAYVGALWAIPPLLFLGGVAAYKVSSQGRLLVAAAAIITLLLPFGLHLLSAGYMPTRSLVGVPVAVWFFVYLALTSTVPLIRIPSAVLLAVALFQIMVIQNAYQASMHLVGKHDALLAAAINERLATTPGFDPKTTYALSTFGGQSFVTPYPRPPTSTIGHSFFEWDGGNPYRITSYMRLLGFAKVRGPSPEQMDQTIIRLTTMPIWPAPGSIQIDGDIALVKLGETPGSFNRLALERAGKQ